MSEGWHPDPWKRHEFRFWDGSSWTEHVADNGQPGIDQPVGDLPTEPAALRAARKAARAVAGPARERGGRSASADQVDASPSHSESSVTLGKSARAKHFQRVWELVKPLESERPILLVRAIRARTPQSSWMLITSERFLLVQGSRVTATCGLRRVEGVEAQRRRRPATDSVDLSLGANSDALRIPLRDDDPDWVADAIRLARERVPAGASEGADMPPQVEGREDPARRLAEIDGLPIGDGTLLGVHPVVREYVDAVRDAAEELVEVRRGQLRWDAATQGGGWDLYERELVDRFESPVAITGVETVQLSTSGTYTKEQGWFIKETTDTRRSVLSIAGAGWSRDSVTAGAGQDYLTTNPRDLNDDWMTGFVAVFKQAVGAAPESWRAVEDELESRAQTLRETAGNRPSLDDREGSVPREWLRADLPAASLFLVLDGQEAPKNQLDAVRGAIGAALSDLSADELVLDALVSGSEPGQPLLALVTTRRVIVVNEGEPTLLTSPVDQVKAKYGFGTVKLTVRGEKWARVANRDRQRARAFVRTVNGELLGRAAGIADIDPYEVPDMGEEPTTGQTPSVAAELDRLSAIRREGLLTDAEFKAAKQKVLGLEPKDLE